MRFCVNITTGPLAGSLEDDDLRGEGRWERLVTRGLLDIGAEVGTTAPKWAGDRPNWIGRIGDLSDCAYVTIYGGLESLPRGAGAYLFQFFSAPNAPIEEEIRSVIARVGRDNVFLTHSYPSDGCFDHLPPDLRDRARLLPLPVPAVTTKDATTNTVLFHPSRVAPTEAVLRFVRRALSEDQTLTFETLSSTYSAGDSDASWESPLFRTLLGDVRPRVTIHPPISHADVQQIYARARLVVCASGYGGPPLESARCGIPVIALERDCSLYSAPYTPGFPELPRLCDGRQLVDVLDQLLHDISYARRVGDACRQYVADHYSAAALRRALGGILGDRL